MTGKELQLIKTLIKQASFQLREGDVHGAKIVLETIRVGVIQYADDTTFKTYNILAKSLDLPVLNNK